MVGFDLLHYIHGFVVGVPTDSIHKADPVHQTHRDVGAKFNGVPRVASHDGPDVGLADAHQAIGDRMIAVRIHPELLPIQFLNDEQLTVVLVG